MVIGRENGVTLPCLPTPGDLLQLRKIQTDAVTAGVLGGLIPEMEILFFVNDYSHPGQVLELDGDPAVRESDVQMASVRPLNQVPDLLPDLYRWVVLLDLIGKGVLEVGLRVKTGLRRPRNLAGKPCSGRCISVVKPP